jgi:hypothetical protein
MRISDYFRKFFTGRISHERSTSQTLTAPTDAAIWLAASNNPFGVRVLDCRAFIANVSAWSSDPNVAKQFAQARNRDGLEYLNQRPKNAVQLPTNLSFPYNGAHVDGPIFMAQVNGREVGYVFARQSAVRDEKLDWQTGHGRHLPLFSRSR